MRALVGVAAAAIAVAAVAGCSSGSNDSSSNSANSSNSASASNPASGSMSATESAGATSAAGNGGQNDALSPADQAVQDKINQALSAAPIKFTAESADLNDASKNALTQVAGALKDNKAKIKVETHAGYADAQKAQTLSQERADAISKALVDDGVAQDRITANATGNQTAQGEQALETQISVTP